MFRLRLPRRVRQPLPIVWEKLTHPLVWPVDFGPPARVLKGIIAHYNQEHEVRDHSEGVKEGLEEIEQYLVNGPMAKRASVLHVGCGAGREPIALAKLGYKVVGIDIAPRMIEAAQRNARAEGLEIRFLTLAAHEVTPELGSFDYVLTTPSFYTFIPTTKLRIHTLQSLVRVLKPEGKLFLTAPWVPRDYRLGPRARLVEELRRLRRLTRCGRFETEPGDVLIRRSDGDPTLPLFSHIFYRRDPIEEEIQQAGLTGEHLTSGTWELRISPDTHHLRRS